MHGIMGWRLARGKDGLVAAMLVTWAWLKSAVGDYFL
jgi:hypothetical protein